MEGADLLVEESENESVSGLEDTPRRGVKAGSRRGTYNKVPPDARKRIMDCYRAGGDWKMAATANGVAVKTAYGYIRRGDGDREPRKRGGATVRKVNAETVEKLVGYVEANPQLSLREMANKLREDTGVDLSINTIHKHLHGQLFTIKKILPEPVTMNSAANKEKRADFVRKVMEANGAGKTVLFMDETNVNLFLRRSEGWSRRGSRCCVKTATSKGDNVHIIGAISQTGPVYWERRRGSFRKEDCLEWLRRALRHCNEDMDRIAVVCDNAPAHVSLETIQEEPEFEGVEIIRTAPYSAPLNPIEECWSAVKAAMKGGMASSFAEMMATEVGLTQTEHRLRYIERHIDAAMTRITPMMCMHACNHVQKHFAACLALMDLAMGV